MKHYNFFEFQYFHHEVMKQQLVDSFADNSSCYYTKDVVVHANVDGDFERAAVVANAWNAEELANLGNIVPFDDVDNVEDIEIAESLKSVAYVAFVAKDFVATALLDNAEHGVAQLENDYVVVIDVALMMNDVVFEGNDVDVDAVAYASEEEIDDD